MDSHESYFKSVEGALWFERSELANLKCKRKSLKSLKFRLFFSCLERLNFIKLVSLTHTIFFPFLYDSVSNIK
jgi:hypothetical protein